MLYTTFVLFWLAVVAYCHFGLSNATEWYGFAITFALVVAASICGYLTNDKYRQLKRKVENLEEQLDAMTSRVNSLEKKDLNDIPKEAQVLQKIAESNVPKAFKRDYITQIPYKRNSTIDISSLSNIPIDQIDTIYQNGREDAIHELFKFLQKM